MAERFFRLILALLLSFIVSCGSQEPSIPSAMSFLPRGGPLQISFASEKELAGWRLRTGISSARVTSEGLELRFTGKDPYLSRPLTPPVYGIALLRLRTLEPEAPFRVYFRVNGRELESAALDTLPSPDDPRVQTAEVPLQLSAGYPIEEIRLDPSSDDNELTLVSLSLSPAVGETWLDIGGNARRCVRTPSARSAIYAPDGANLHLGVGVVGAVPGQSAELFGRVLGRNGQVVHTIERSLDRERSTWVDLFAELSPSHEPLNLELSVRSMDGVLLESCFEQPIVTRVEPSDRPNVLLISIDTLRFDHLEYAPFMSRLAREGRSFEAMRSSSSWTLPSHISLFTSLPVSEHAIPHLGDRSPFLSSKLSDDVATLPAALKQAGYFTGASTDGGFMGRRYGLSNGFDRFTTPPGGAHTRSWKTRPLSFVRKMIRDQGTRPFFAFVHTYKAHDYFLNTSDYHDYVQTFSKGLRERGSLLEFFREGRPSELPDGYLRSLYASGVGRADELVEELVNLVLQETSHAPLLVVITSDHGESFGEHRNIWHHGTSLYEEQIRVPLIAWSNADPRLIGESGVPSSTIDVAPSILRWLELSVPTVFSGRSDRFSAEPSAEREFPVQASMARVAPIGMEQVHQTLTDGNWKYIRSDRYDGSLIEEQCFHLKSDRHESRDRMGQESECQRFRSMFAQLLRRSRGAVVVESSVPVSFRTSGVRQHTDGLVAVRPSLPVPEPIANLQDGSIEWTPSVSDGVLAVIPSLEGLVFDQALLAGVSVAEAIKLADIGSDTSPSILVSNEAKAVMYRRSLGTNDVAASGELEDAEILEQLRALGYLEK